MLTKSNYLYGLQCPKLLWNKKNNEDEFGELDSVAHHKFEAGERIGNMAKLWYSDGVDIPIGDFAINLNKTKELMEKRVPLFEAGFLVSLTGVGDIFSRCDILVPIGSDAWDIVEIKSGARVKDINIHDVSFQKYVYEKAGLKINKCYLMHINNSYVRDGEVDFKELFIQIDITEKVDDVSSGIKKRVEKMFDVISSPEPDVKIGGQCKSPYMCPLKDKCWKFLPENNVFEFCRGGQKSIDIFEDGIVQMIDVSDEYKLTATQRVQVEAARSGEVRINKEKINEFLGELNYPLYCLDFETINPAIPLFDKTRAYMQIPFQYSLHIQNEPNGELKHISFLAEGMDDPREKFMQSLRENLGDSGDIIVYNQAFEKMIIRQCAEVLDEFRDWSAGILDRVKDLMAPFSKFYYYDSRQKGSVSIKKVLPVLSDLSYSEMEIANGAVAQLEYERVTYSPVDDEDRLRVYSALEKYCELDTLAEVKIIEGLGRAR